MQKGVTEIEGQKYFFGENTYKLFKNSRVTSLNETVYITDGNGIIINI